MKIFSLETKKHLAVWSVILGTVFYKVFNFIALKYRLRDCNSGFFSYGVGYPFEWGNIACHPELEGVSPPKDYYQQFIGVILNFIFWIFVALIILLIIRYFFKKASHS